MFLRNAVALAFTVGIGSTKALELSNYLPDRKPCAFWGVISASCTSYCVQKDFIVSVDNAELLLEGDPEADSSGLFTGSAIIRLVRRLTYACSLATLLVQQIMMMLGCKALV